jgi:hypothetical protein
MGLVNGDVLDGHGNDFTVTDPWVVGRGSWVVGLSDRKHR